MSKEQIMPQFLAWVKKLESDLNESRNQTAAARSAINRFDECELTADECVEVIRSILV